jgi:hypothetical protein
MFEMESKYLNNAPTQEPSEDMNYLGKMTMSEFTSTCSGKYTWNEKGEPWGTLDVDSDEDSVSTHPSMPDLIDCSYTGLYE